MTTERKVRKRLKLRIEEVAAEMGIDFTYLSKMESGKNTFPQKHREAFYQALANLTVDMIEGAQERLQWLRSPETQNRIVKRLSE